MAHSVSPGWTTCSRAGCAPEDDARQCEQREGEDADDHAERGGPAADVGRSEHVFDDRANACSCQGRNAKAHGRVYIFDMSTDISTTILPLVPLDDGVILPNMAIAIAITSDEARAAVDDALATDGPPRVVIATRRNGVFSTIGVVAELDGQPAMLPGGVCGATIRALHRAELGTGQGEGVGGALRIEVTEHPDSDRGQRARARARTRVPHRHRGDPRGARCERHRRVPAHHRPPRRARGHRGLLARPLARAQDRAARDARRRAPARARPVVGARHAGRDRAAPEDPRRRRGGHGQVAARVRAEAPARRHPQGARRRGRRRRHRALSRADRRDAPLRRGAQGGRARARPPRRAPARATPRPPPSAPTSTGCCRCRGARSRRTRTTSQPRAQCSRPTTPAWKRSRTASSSTWRCAASGASARSRTRAAEPSSAWSGPPASARRRWASRSPVRSDASSCA